VTFGVTRAEVAKRFPDGFARWQAGDIGHDGETREQLTARVVAAVERIAGAHEGATVLVVTHGGAIRALRRHAAGDPGAVLENAATVAFALVEGAIVLGGTRRPRRASPEALASSVRLARPHRTNSIRTHHLVARARRCGSATRTGPAS
jgi:broad specificity phosphatase PhoE